MRRFNFGAYPTMVTPYHPDNTVDYDAVKKMVKWYWDEGCAGIFASCQSSEIHFLSVEDRVKLAKVVKETADELAAADKSREPMTIVASGHVSDSFEDQLVELKGVAETGVDALILISNRFDIDNTSDEAWIADCQRMMDALPADVALGIYECPRPYKRLLTPAMIDFMVKSGRFAYIKDTCCDAEEIARRVKQIADTDSPDLKPMLFDANAQTLLMTLRAGCSGYCGVMANFHPHLYAWLCDNFEKQPEKADLVGAFICVSAYLECLTYPATAKYHLNRIGISMPTLSRSCDASKMGPYDMSSIDDMARLAEHFESIIA